MGIKRKAISQREPDKMEEGRKRGAATRRKQTRKVSQQNNFQARRQHVQKDKTIEGKKMGNYQ